MAKKKIVHIAQSAGGVAEYLYMFLKNWSNDKYENILIVSEDYKEQLNRFKPFTSQISIVPMVREIQPQNDIKSIISIKKILRKIKPDIVYLHSSKAGAIGRIALAFNLKTKILYNAHGWYFNAQISNKKKKIFALIEKILAIKTNKIINISKNEYESALEYKIASKRKMCIIENGIDFKKFENCEEYRIETRQKYNISNDDIVIGVVGRITEQKDPITTVKAFNDIYTKNRKVKLMYVGSGDLEDEVVKYEKENNLEGAVTITGWVNNVEKYIPAFDIAILPSKWEGFGLTLIEYMACNKPIIASNVGGIINIIQNNKNGLIFQNKEYMDLSDKIETILNNKQLRENMINQNKEYRNKYDISKLIKNHENLFEKL